MYIDISLTSRTSSRSSIDFLTHMNCAADWAVCAFAQFHVHAHHANVQMVNMICSHI